MSNIIKASLSSAKRTTSTKAVYQFDYGQIVEVEGVTLPSSFEAHVGFLGGGSTTIVLGSNQQVHIPNMYLRTSRGVVVYIFLHETDSDGEVKYEIHIPVVARSAASGAVPTEEEQNIITQAIAAFSSVAAEAEAAQEAATAVWEAAERGEFGVSPTVELEDADGGHIMTVTDVNGEHEYFIPDGEGMVNIGLPRGGETGQILVKDGTSDFVTRWDSSFNAEYVVNVTLSGISYTSDRTFAQIEAAILAGKKIVLRYSHGDNVDIGYSYSYKPIIYDGEFYEEGGINFSIVGTEDALCLTSANTWYRSTTIIGYDRSIDPTSINAVQNAVIAAALDKKITNPTVSTVGQVLRKINGGEAWQDVHEVPASGLTGQVLKKSSTADYALEWADEADGLPDGGTVGQVLTKTSDGAAWSNAGTPTTEQIETAVDDWLDDHAASIDGLSFEAKNALLTLLRHVAYTDDNGEMYYNALEQSLVGGATLDHINVVYNPGTAVIYVTDTLDSLRQYITVTAYYSDSSYSVVDTYTLSGTLSNGSNTITVTYGTESENITVIATQYELYDYIYNSRTSGTGTDYVDTGLTHSPSFNTLNIEFEAMNSNNTSDADALICANNTTTNDTGNMVWYARANKGGFSAYNLGVAKQLSAVPGDTRAVVKYFFVNGGQSYMQWGNTTVNVATKSIAGVSSNNKTLLLAGGYAFSTGEKYGLRNNGISKLGYVKFSDPDTDQLLYHFIPAHDVVNDTWGFYEDVNDVFYPSNGSYYRCANWS